MVLGAGFVSQAEVDAAGAARKLVQTISRCADRESATRAIRWASPETPANLKCEPSMSDGLFGPVLAVDDNGTPVAVPVGFLLDGIHDAVAMLTSITLEARGQPEKLLAAAKSRTPASDFRAGSATRTRRDRGSKPDRRGAAGRRRVAAAVGTSPRPSRATTSLARKRALSGLRAWGDVWHRARTFEISERDEIIRLVVVHHAESITPSRGSDDLAVSSLAVEDLRWIMTQSDRPDDLAMFLRSLQQDHAERMFSFGPFDLWEYWSANNGAFHRRGQPLTALFFSPHSERAEWHWQLTRRGSKLLCSMSASTSSRLGPS